MSPTRTYVFVLVLLWLVVGCNDKTQLIDDSRAKLIQEKRQLQQEKAALEQEITQLQEQIATLQKFPPDRMTQLVKVEKIEFGKFTRAYDGDLEQDQDGYDDGVLVYLILKDKDGDVVKAAGTVEIEIWDLAAAKHIIGELIPMSDLQNYWLSGPLTNHYKFQLPWPKANPPTHRFLTLKLRFQEALTGKTFEEYQKIEVRIRSQK
jgi:hypothetical protein